MERAWRIVTWAGFLGTTYYLLCVAGAPRIKFLTELEATAFDFGLISSLAAVVLVFQVAGSLIGNRLRRRKAFWMFLAITHRLVFTGVILAPVLFGAPRTRMVWIFFVLFCHDALAQVSVPIWFSWMADLVPAESVNRRWAARQQSITAATIAVMILIALGFHYFERTGHVFLGFAVLAIIGLVLGVVDILLFLWVPEPEHERVENTGWLETVLQPLRDREFRPFLLFMGYWHFAVFAAEPFFGLYMIERLELNVMTVQLLGTGAALGTAVSSRFWGLVCDRYGYRPTLQLLSQAKVFTPAAFIFVPKEPAYSIPILAVVLFVDGVLNAGMALALQGPLLKSTPRRNRTMYIAAANLFAIGVMASLAPALSGRLINGLESGYSLGGMGLNGYQFAFAASGLLRLGAFVLASRIYEPGASSLGTLTRQALTRNALRVPHLVHVLQSSNDEGARSLSARQLGSLRSPLAIGGLIQALQDRSLAVRNAATEALGTIGASDASEALSRSLFDPGSGIQSPAARALGRIGCVNSLKALLKNLRNQDSHVLAETIESLVRIGDDAAILPLICLFNEVEDEDLRVRIATALAKLNQIESVEEIFDLLRARRPLNQQILR